MGIFQQLSERELRTSSASLRAYEDQNGDEGEEAVANTEGV
jgi:hypothetical protein